MDPVRADIVENLYSGDQAAAPFLDPEPPVEVRLSVKHQQDSAMRKHQRDMGLAAHALTTGLEDLKRTSVRQGGHPRVTQRDNPGGDSPPGPCPSPDGFTFQWNRTKETG